VSGVSVTLNHGMVFIETQHMNDDRRTQEEQKNATNQKTETKTVP